MLQQNKSLLLYVCGVRRVELFGFGTHHSHNPNLTLPGTISLPLPLLFQGPAVSDSIELIANSYSGLRHEVFLANVEGTLEY